MGLTINSNFSGVAYGASSAMKSAQGIMGRSLKKISTNKAYAGGGGGGAAAVKASAKYKISAAKNEAAYYKVQQDAASLSQTIAMQESKLEAIIANAGDSNLSITITTAFAKDPAVGSVGDSITDASTLATSLATNYNTLQVYDYQASYYQNMAGAGESSYAAVTDTDIAMEMSKYVKANVNSQAAQAMVAQANQSMATILNLLQ